MSSKSAAAAAAVPPTVKVEKEDIRQRILNFCKEYPCGVADKMLQAAMPDVDSGVRAKAINDLLVSGKIDLFKSSSTEEPGLLLKVRNTTSKASTIKGDQEEKIVYGIIEEAGNKGTWIRDIRIKSNLIQTQLNKALKSLESKKLIKVVKSVNATKKKVYMLYHLEPDRSVTGGAWYSDQDFESEFVEILNQQCYRYLHKKLELSREKGASLGPIAARKASCVSSNEVLKFISELGISKIQLKIEDIEMILDTLIFDGKVERMSSIAGKDKDGETLNLYRGVETLLPPTGLVRFPCGICPVIKDCNPLVGSITPSKCTYLKEWLE